MSFLEKLVNIELDSLIFLNFLKIYFYFFSYNKTSNELEYTEHLYLFLSELIFDIPNFKVIKYSGENIELKYLTNKNYSNLPMYTNDSTEDTIAVKCGDVFIKILRSSNKQIRSEVSLGGHSHIEDPYGFLVFPMNTKICKLKKLDTIKLLEKKKTPNFKREVHNYFYTINKDTKQCEKKIQSINCF